MFNVDVEKIQRYWVEEELISFFTDAVQIDRWEDRLLYQGGRGWVVSRIARLIPDWDKSGPSQVCMNI